jgi:uncharacterized protein YcaQ
VTGRRRAKSDLTVRRGATRAEASLSPSEARRIALAAQGFASPRPRRSPGADDLVGTVRRLGVLQIDSVNVLVRSHYLPAYSRLGPYDASLLDRAAYGDQRRALFEYWGHEASLLPVELQPLLRWRMERARAGVGVWASVARLGRERATLCESVLAEIRARGPIGVSELEGAGRRGAGWWGWSEGKIALEWLFWTGQITTHSRRRFERVYELTERALPSEVIATPTPAPEEAQRALLRIAIRALGVATERDLRDYFRLTSADAKARIAELVEEGTLRPVAVEGWRAQAYLDPNASVPRRVNARALLSPFDSLVWERQRTERLFGFRYRLEIYTPAKQREHGYYVLPFLLGDRLVARVDLKADRPGRTLRVVRAHCEPAPPPTDVAGPLREELTVLAAWLGLDRIAVSRRRGFTQSLRPAASSRAAHTRA